MWIVNKLHLSVSSYLFIEYLKSVQKKFSCHIILPRGGITSTTETQFMQISWCKTFYLYSVFFKWTKLQVFSIFVTVVLAKICCVNYTSEHLLWTELNRSLARILIQSNYNNYDSIDYFSHLHYFLHSIKQWITCH